MPGDIGLRRRGDQWQYRCVAAAPWDWATNCSGGARSASSISGARTGWLTNRFGLVEAGDRIAVMIRAEKDLIQPDSIDERDRASKSVDSFIEGPDPDERRRGRRIDGMHDEHSRQITGAARLPYSGNPGCLNPDRFIRDRLSPSMSGVFMQFEGAPSDVVIARAS